MEDKEKAILRAVAKNLEKSAWHTWLDGRFDDWIEWARDMRVSIENNVDIIRSLTEQK